MALYLELRKYLMLILLISLGQDTNLKKQIHFVHIDIYHHILTKILMILQNTDRLIAN
jgi:hypothetical protein